MARDHPYLYLQFRRFPCACLTDSGLPTLLCCHKGLPDMITVKEVVLSMNTIKSTKKWQEDEALRRFRLISPILDESLDPAKRLQVRKEIADKAGVTTRSLYRYEAAYRSGGFAGLKPMNREQRRSFALPENFEELCPLRRPDHPDPGDGRPGRAGHPEAVNFTEISLRRRFR